MDNLLSKVGLTHWAPKCNSWYFLSFGSYKNSSNPSNFPVVGSPTNLCSSRISSVTNLIGKISKPVSIASSASRRFKHLYIDKRKFLWKILSLTFCYRILHPRNTFRVTVCLVRNNIVFWFSREKPPTNLLPSPTIRLRCEKGTLIRFEKLSLAQCAWNQTINETFHSNRFRYSAMKMIPINLLLRLCL